MNTDYENLDRRAVPLLPVLEHSVKELLKGISRKLTKRGRHRLLTSITICPLVFEPYLIAIKRDQLKPTFVHLSKYSIGRGHEAIRSALAKFTSLEDLSYHLEKVLKGEDTSSFFQKSLPQGARAVANISPACPALIRYDSKKGKVSLQFDYFINNRYGEQCVS